MIPAKIISFEEAKKLGLTSEINIDRGRAIIGAGVVASGKNGEKPEISQKSIMRADGTHELVLMTEQRKKELQDSGVYEEHLDQFHAILGEKKKDFFLRNNLKLKEKV
jgi:hypothetical protein